MRADRSGRTVLRLRLAVLAVAVAVAATHDRGGVAVALLTALVAVDAAGTAVWVAVRGRFPRRSGGRTDGAPPAPESVLLRAVCHELRAPVSSLGALTRALNDDRRLAAPALRREVARLAHAQAVHLDELLRQAAAASQGLTVPAAEPRTPLERVLPAVAAVVPPGRLRLDVSLAAARYPVDAARLRHVLTNLLENAVRHGPARGAVELSARTAADGLVLSVVDEGDLADDLRAALSRPEPPAGMSGLGLWVVRRLVTAAGGTVTARALPGRGAAVEVRLPLRPAEPVPGLAALVRS